MDIIHHLNLTLEQGRDQEQRERNGGESFHAANFRNKGML